jgi:hypothetical protein
VQLEGAKVMRKRLLVGLFVALLGLGFTAAFRGTEGFGGGAVYVACSSNSGDYCSSGG